MIGKRGDGWDFIMHGVLWLILLIIIIFMFGGMLLEPIKDFFMKVSGLGFDEREFVPYEAGVTSDEETVLNSINALVLGIKSVSKNELLEIPEDLACPEAKENDKVCCEIMRGGNNVWYEYKEYTKEECKDNNGRTVTPSSKACAEMKPVLPICLECKENGGVECSVKGFELPQTFDLIDSDVWISGAGDPLYTLYYQAFPVGEDALWHVDEYSFLIDVVLFGAALNVIPVVGSYGARGRVLVMEKIRTGFSQQGMRKMKKEFKNIVSDIGTKLSDNAISEFAMVFRKKTYHAFLKSRLLHNSLLESGVKTEIAGEVREIVAAKLARYARRKNLVFDEKAMNQLLKELDDEVFKVKGVTRETIETKIKSLPDIDGNLKFLDEANPKIRVLNEDQFLKYKITKRAYLIGEEEKSVNQLANYLKAENEFIEAEVKRVAQYKRAQTIVNKKEMKDIMINELKESVVKKLQTQEKAKRFFQQHILEEKEVGVFIVKKEVLENLFTKKTFNEFEKLAPEMQEAYLRKSAEYMDELMKVSKDGTFDFNWAMVLGRSSDDPIVARIAGQFETFYDESYKKLGELDKGTWTRLLTGYGPEEYKGAYKVLKSPKQIYEHFKEISPLQVRIARFPGTNIPYRPAVMSTIGATFGTSAKDVGAILNWMQRNRIMRYTLAYNIAGELAKADSINEKFKGQGEDALVLWQPFDYERSRKYHIEETKGYYVNLMKEDGFNSRFFLASPCKVDLTIVKNQIGCELDSGVYLLENGNEYGLPFEPGSVEFFNVPEVIYEFDGLTRKEKNREMGYCFKDKFEDCFNVFFKLEGEKWDKIRDLFLKEIADFIDEVSEKKGTEDYNEDYLMYQNIKGIALSNTLFSDYLNKQIMSEKFKERLSEDLMKGFYSKRTDQFDNLQGQKAAIQRMYFYYNKGGKFKEIFKDDGIMWILARENYFHYFKVKESDIDRANMVYLCEEGDITGKPRLIDGDRKRGITIQSISVKPDLNEYKEYNNKRNYCFSSEHKAAEMAKWTAVAAAVIVDIGVAASGPGLFVEAPVTMITGAGAAWIAKEIEWKNRWPNH